MTDETVELGEEDSQKDDVEALLTKIADQLSDLSTAEDFPTGYGGEIDPFDPGDVDFSSTTWLLRLLQVQGWLFPSAEVERKAIEEDAYAAATAFFGAIGAEDPNVCIGEKAGSVSLTPVGAEYLAGRLDTAVDRQRQFLESLESESAKQATEQWIEAWEEAGEELASSEPIRARSEVWGINDFAGRARRGQLNLNPSYQRGDVWPTRDAQKLMESILRGIPLPSIILLRPKSGGAHAKYEVVDGKQRLTSILRFIGQHPGALARIRDAAKRFPKANLQQLFNTNYKRFRRAWKNATGEALTDKKEAEYYFPFRLAKASKAFEGELAHLGGKYYYEIREEMINVGDSHAAVADVFEMSSDYKIPLIEYLEASARQVHEVFHLYNRQGKHLNAEEIRNALYHEVDLVRLVLVASGDNKSAKELAPYITEEQLPMLADIADSLDGYRFGVARYRRTKLLSWMYALLFQPSEQHGDVIIKSTAKQIDSLFEAIQKTSTHRLAEHDALRSLIADTRRCLDAHSSADCWDAKFKDDDKGQKWQELQLVASLVAVFLMGVLRESPLEVLQEHRKSLLAFTAGHLRPEKTQNKTQWAYIGGVSLGLLEVVGIDITQLHSRLVTRYGVSCLATLDAAKRINKPHTFKAA